MPMKPQDRPIGPVEYGALFLMFTVVLGMAIFFSGIAEPDRTETATSSVSIASKPVEKKRKHDLPPGSIDQKTLALLVLGDGITVIRSGPEATIPVGYGVKVMIPVGVEMRASREGEAVVVKSHGKAPYILLPVIGRLWTVGIVGMRLVGDTLTIELDGWTDYVVKIK